MKQYVELVNRIIDEGEYRKDRTGVGTVAVFGGRVEFDLRDRFPLVTIKETRWRVAFLEMLWFLRGEKTTAWLNAHACKLWDAWANRGYLGPIYGHQWRDWDGIDQISDLINGLINNPGGRRHIVSAWNVGELGFMALPPCHWAFQCYVGKGEWLDMQVNQRSWDIALGAPFNIAQYALLLTLLARAAGLKPRRLSFCYGDAHIYMNHLDVMREIADLANVVPDNAQLVINTENTGIDGYKPEDFDIVGYTPGPFIKLPVAV